MFCKVYKGNPVEFYFSFIDFTFLIFSQFLILFLETIRELASLISLGILFHILAAILEMNSIPKPVEWMFDLSR